MDDKERLEKLEQAEKLIREVEFSYPVGSDIRRNIFKSVVDTFGFSGILSNIMLDLRKKVRGY
jgi:hypothetical protein